MLGGTEASEAATTDELAANKAQMEELRSQHQQAVDALEKELAAARATIDEERQQRTAVDVMNEALNRELMDSHHLLYRHGTWHLLKDRCKRYRCCCCFTCCTTVQC